MIDQVALLKKMAIDKYKIDGGTMFECFDDADYAEYIADYKTAKKAWKGHIYVLEAQRESGGYYERDNGEF